MKKSLLTGVILIAAGNLAMAANPLPGGLPRFEGGTPAAGYDLRVMDARSGNEEAGRALMADRRFDEKITLKEGPVAGRRDPRTVSLSGAEIYGWLGANGDIPGGWYKVDTDGTYKLQWDCPSLTNNMGNVTNGWIVDGKLCGLAAVNVGGMILGYNYVEFDLEKGTPLKSDLIGGNNLDLSTYYTTCAYVPSEKKIYGYCYASDTGSSFRFASSPADNIGNVSQISMLASNGDRATSLCYNEEDNAFYGVTYNGDFVRIGFDGTQTKIFNLGLENVKTDQSGLVYSPKDDCYIYTPVFYDYCSQMYYIYPDKKEIRFIANYETDLEFFFLLSEGDAYDKTAPARPALVSENFVPGALSGDMTFKLPSKTGGGEALSGSLAWTMYVDNVKYKDGTGTPGSDVKIDFTNLTQGEHVFRFAASAAGKEGRGYVVAKYMGNGRPYSPANVVLEAGKVTWDAVTEAELGGYLDLSKMSYEVYVNDEKVGTSTGTSLDITLDPDKEVSLYYAYVKAVCNGLSSDAAKSNKLIYGAPIKLPYTIVPTQAQADLTTVINADGGPSYGVWDFSEARWHEPVFYSGWGLEDADDWLILPPVDCSDISHAFRLTLDAICGGTTGDDERFEVWCGDAPTVEAMTTLILPETQVSEFITEGWDTFTNLFVPKTAGPCYIAIRALSPPHQYSLLIRKIIIEQTDQVADIPAAPADFKIVSSSDADLQAVVSMVLPDKTISGKAIDATVALKAVVKVGEKIAEKTGKPGETIEMTVDTYQGDNRLEAYCMINGQAGQSATVNVFTGTIPPNFVENFKAVVSRDNMSVTLSWTAPLGGQENLEGYYSPKGMHYWLFEPRQGQWGTEWTPIKDLGDVLEYTWTVPEGEPLEMKYVGIAAANDGGVSEALCYAYRELGKPYEAIVDETFTVGNDAGVNYEPLRFMTDGEYTSVTWEMVWPEEVYPDAWNADIPYAIIGYSSSSDKGGTGRFSLPKMSTVGVEEPVLTIRLWSCQPRGAVSVYASTFGKENYTKIYDVPASLDAGWEDVYVEIPKEYWEMPWISLAVNTELSAPKEYTIIGGYRFSSKKDSSVADMEIAEGIVFGGRGEIVVSGHEGAALEVYTLDGMRVASVPSVGALERVAAEKGIYIVKCGDRKLKVAVK